jgi:peptidyl-prolyl cis-trans isomerase A (cyclophilin A)
VIAARNRRRVESCEYDALWRVGPNLERLVMKIPFTLSSVLAFAALLVGCQQNSEQAATAPASSPAASAADAKLTPLSGKEGAAPALTEVTTVRLATTAGDVVIEVYPQAAPNAAQRFTELARSGFYDDTPISRVVPGFVAQFGVNWREPHKAWKDREFIDDPSFFALERGTLAFAKAGQPNTASTQVFINYRENNRLADPAPNLSFWVFGKVVQGMDVVDKFVQVGDPSGGLNQDRLWADGGAYLESLPVKPTMIESATVQ